LKEQYTKFSHEFVRTGPILGLDLPAKATTIPNNIYEATTIQQAETANHNLVTEGERGRFMFDPPVVYAQTGILQGAALASGTTLSTLPVVTA